jgi:hypothetical protein
MVVVVLLSVKMLRLHDLYYVHMQQPTTHSQNSEKNTYDPTKNLFVLPQPLTVFTNVCITCNLPYGRHTTNTDPSTHCITYPATEECFTIYKGTTVRKYFLYTTALLTHIWEGLTTRDRSNVIIFVLPWGRNRKSHRCQESSNLPWVFYKKLSTHTVKSLYWVTVSIRNMFRPSCWE